ncbi:MAG: glycosyltransferase [Pseudomonadota bacterium]
MKVAFYAPLKPPDHPVPSGDRAMARAVMAALARGGHAVHLASTLQARDGAGDAQAQDAVFATAAAEVTRLSTDPQTRDCEAWITYHNYYKAPDLLGPRISRALGIPYLQIESTRARKRLNGPWARFAAAAEAASDAAHTILYLTHRDAETLRRDAPDGQVLRHLPPFLVTESLPVASDLRGPMLSVGMMRAGDKRASYALIAQTLAALPADLNWRLDIAGDGAARAEVAAMMARFGDRVRLLGALDGDALAAAYRRASLFLWPGVNEAFGLVYLEARAAGLPVVAQDRPGVRDVVTGAQPQVSAGPGAMAAMITTLLRDDSARWAAGQAARQAVAARHLIGPAADTLTAVLEGAA